jgi:hypothetical protein
MAAAPMSSHPEVDGHLALEFDSCRLEAPGVVAGVAEETTRVEGWREEEDIGLQGLENLPAEAVAYIKSLQSKLADSQEVSFGCIMLNPVVLWRYRSNVDRLHDLVTYWTRLWGLCLSRCCRKLIPCQGPLEGALLPVLRFTCGGLFCAFWK